MCCLIFISLLLSLVLHSLFNSNPWIINLKKRRRPEDMVWSEMKSMAMCYQYSISEAANLRTHPDSTVNSINWFSTTFQFSNYMFMSKCLLGQGKINWTTSVPNLIIIREFGLVHQFDYQIVSLLSEVLPTPPHHLCDLFEK